MTLSCPFYCLARPLPQLARFTTASFRPARATARLDALGWQSSIRAPALKNPTGATIAAAKSAPSAAWEPTLTCALNAIFTMSAEAANLTACKLSRDPMPWGRKISQTAPAPAPAWPLPYSQESVQYHLGTRFVLVSRKRARLEAD